MAAKAGSIVHFALIFSARARRTEALALPPPPLAAAGPDRGPSPLLSWLADVMLISVYDGGLL